MNQTIFSSINPFTNEVIESYEAQSPEEVNTTLQQAQLSFEQWRGFPMDARAACMRKLAHLLRNRKEPLARLITMEMGKILAESAAEIEKCAWLCEYYAEEAASLLEKEIFETDASDCYVRFDPLGIIYGIMPWNFPFWQVLRAAVPTMMAGNAFALKHAPNVFGCASAIEMLFKESGFPASLFTNLIIDIPTSDTVIAHPLIKGVSLTGSLGAGKAVAAQAAISMKKSVFELGGSDPFIVLKDADIYKACKTGLDSRMLNGGQVCIAAKRFIVEASVIDEFVSTQKALLEALRLGDPMDPKTDVGPMARKDLLAQLERQVTESVKMGAKIVTGGSRLSSGLFYRPTLLTQVTKGMPVFDEETFGAVSVVVSAQDADEAIHIANDTHFGLGASLWTQNIDLAHELATRIEAGAVFINGMTKSDPRLPFGGTKLSGYGRELGPYGIKEFVNIKTVWVK